MLNNITENKQQMVHIITELLVMGGIVYYFNQKHKKFISEIQELNDKVEEHENALQTNEMNIRKIVEVVMTLQQQKNNSELNTKMLEQQIEQQKTLQQRITQVKELEDDIIKREKELREKETLFQKKAQKPPQKTYMQRLREQKAQKQKEQVTPQVEETQVEQVTPQVEETQVEQVTPQVEETQVEQVTPQVEETQVEQVTPQVLQMQVEETQDIFSQDFNNENKLETSEKELTTILENITIKSEDKEKLELDKELANELLELEETDDIIEIDTSDLSKNEDLKKNH